jgi:hypothetical protein
MNRSQSEWGLAGQGSGGRVFGFALPVLAWSHPSWKCEEKHAYIGFGIQCRQTSKDPKTNV